MFILFSKKSLLFSCSNINFSNLAIISTGLFSLSSLNFSISGFTISSYLFLSFSRYSLAFSSILSTLIKSIIVSNEEISFILLIIVSMNFTILFLNISSYSRLLNVSIKILCSLSTSSSMLSISYSNVKSSNI